MFPSSFKKFYSVLGMSFLLGLGAISFLEPTTGVTGLVTSVNEPVTFPWPVFLFGLFVGACAVGLMFGLIHHERNRL